MSGTGDPELMVVYALTLLDLNLLKSDISMSVSFSLRPNTQCGGFLLVESEGRASCRTTPAQGRL
jgi:hypothetical protein